MKCCICGARGTTVGLLCKPCHEVLQGPIPITREQIRAAHGVPSDAALVDAWGCPHRLLFDTTVGRALDPALFAISDSSISRVHAIIAHTATGWTIQDLASSNGTFVNDQPATSPLRLETGNRVRIGFINFYFIEHAATLIPPAGMDAMGQTVRPTKSTKSPEITFKLSEPSGGGGGVVEIDGTPVHLTLAQYELVARLVTRRLADALDAADTRGFISAEELVSVLSLDSMQPDDDNVRQLVRRVRRALEKAGVGDLIESRYRLGYRLAVQPRLI